MSDYDFEMPWPPTVNHFHQPVVMRSGKKPVARIIKGAKARQYSADMAEHLMILGLAGEQLAGRLSVVLTLHPPTLAKYDIDNRTKGVFDALSESGFWADDEQVDVLTIFKGDKIKGGKVILKVTSLD